MCGRFSWIQTEKKLLIHRFNLNDFPDELKPRYNIAPSQKAPVILNKSPRKLSMIRWGLIPHWSRDEKIGYKMINARAETLLEKPSFREPLQSKRCLVLSDGFYEWKKTPEGKQPYRITLKDNGLFTFAGLYDSWKTTEGADLYTFTIITTEPNDLMKNIHNRMPVILPQDKERLWLDYHLDAQDASHLLETYPSENMKAYPVSKMVNSVENDSPNIIEQVSVENQKTLF